ncbi:MAG: PEGA domain-containing protein [Pseudomonadota bacterium]
MLIVLSGCATITRGTNEAFVIETKPAGAEVSSSTGWSCVTPCSVKVKRRGDFVLTIEKQGFETLTTNVTSSVDGAGAAGMAGNVLVGGIIGAGVDAGTGAMHSHKPNPLVVELVPMVAESAK